MSETEQAPASGGVDVVGLAELARKAKEAMTNVSKPFKLITSDASYFGGSLDASQYAAAEAWTALTTAFTPDAILALTAEVARLTRALEEREQAMEGLTVDLALARTAVTQFSELAALSPSPTPRTEP